ncbi:MAG: hypothetical protein SFU91_09195 [Chloroherpetonaceae bacterium]|nr:hypothetical protein [Chloroherpetonaceae bacterium]
MLSESEETILDNLHFVATFTDLMDECHLSRELLAQTLNSLLTKRLIDILEWSEFEEDYVRIEREADLIPFYQEIVNRLLVSDKLASQYYFLATKKGLQAIHHSS